MLGPLELVKNDSIGGSSNIIKVTPSQGLLSSTRERYINESLNYLSTLSTLNCSINCVHYTGKSMSDIMSSLTATLQCIPLYSLQEIHTFNPSSDCVFTKAFTNAFYRCVWLTRWPPFTAQNVEERHLSSILCIHPAIITMALWQGYLVFSVKALLSS